MTIIGTTINISLKIHLSLRINKYSSVNSLPHINFHVVTNKRLLHSKAVLHTQWFETLFVRLARLPDHARTVTQYKYAYEEVKLPD